MQTSSFAKTTENVTIRSLLCEALGKWKYSIQCCQNRASSYGNQKDMPPLPQAAAVCYFSINCIERQWNIFRKVPFITLILNADIEVSVYTYNNSSYYSVWTSTLSFSTGKGWPTSPRQKEKNVLLLEKGRRVETSCCLVWAIICFYVGVSVPVVGNDEQS